MLLCVRSLTSLCPLSLRSSQVEGGIVGPISCSLPTPGMLSISRRPRGTLEGGLPGNRSGAGEGGLFESGTGGGGIFTQQQERAGVGMGMGGGGLGVGVGVGGTGLSFGGGGVVGTRTIRYAGGVLEPTFGNGGRGAASVFLSFNAQHEYAAKGTDEWRMEDYV